ncbi:hypothetical protein GJ744_007244 [Endocarpon pusillum]|uniref:C2H2-type domain-containing protein n=1 Tax=Endocarpon pusillum TaxID=364733 RepID=A0A8H7ARQ2_9EURO|nr:hypothetical protein GJ744_007244 [Endocarpon pusillum]
MARPNLSPMVKDADQTGTGYRPILKHMPTPSASPERLAGEARGESKIEDDGICCLHCGNIIDGRAHYGFCTDCAYRAKKGCPVCRQMGGDLGRHKKRHSEPGPLRCTAKGCDSTKAFAEESLSHHIQRAHPALLISRERSKKKTAAESSRVFRTAWLRVHCRKLVLLMLSASWIR